MKTIVAAAALAFALASHAEDVKFYTGAVLRGAKIRSVAADGVVIETAKGVTKYPWKYFAADERARLEGLQRDADAKAETERAFEAVALGAIIEPFIFHENRTIAHIQLCQKKATGEFELRGLDRSPKIDWTPVGDQFVGVIDEAMPETVKSGDAKVAMVFEIGHTDDSSRDRLFTTDVEKARTYYAAHPDYLKALQQKLEPEKP
jgi:hypothetical protein